MYIKKEKKYITAHTVPYVNTNKQLKKNTTRYVLINKAVRNTDILTLLTMV